MIRYQHLRFHELKTGEDFFYRKYRYYKVNCITGRAILDGEHVFVMPWTKIRSTRPFGKPKLANCAPIFFGGPAATFVCEGADNVALGSPAGIANPHFGKNALNDCEIPPGNTGLGGAALRVVGPVKTEPVD